MNEFFSLFFHSFNSLEYQKVPHVNLSGQSFKGQTEKERNTIRVWEGSRGWKERALKWEEEMEREERERRLGSSSTSVPRSAAQTVDNGTEVDGRLTALLMEQLKCGLTTCWLSHAKALKHQACFRDPKLIFQ